MTFQDNDRYQELLLVLNDNMGNLNRRWLYVLAAVAVLSIPLFFILRPVFTQMLLVGYHPPEITYQPQAKEPLKIVEKKVFELGPDTYTGFVRIRNINLEWGVPAQAYTASFKSLGGTLVKEVPGVTYVLPASDKIVVFPRFTSDKKVESIEITMGESKFNQKPSKTPHINLDIQRVSTQRQNGEFRVFATVRNLSPFNIKRVGLPVVLYNSKNETVGANYTSINDVLSGESRSVEFFWPANVPASRQEIIPELNIFDRGLLYTEGGQQIFDDFDIDEFN